MADRLDALTAIANAARAIRQTGMVDVRLDALYGALAALDAVGEAPGDVAWDQPVPRLSERDGDTAPDAPYGAQDAICAVPATKTDDYTMRGADGRPARYWCRTPSCWRQNDTAGAYCYQCSAQAVAPSVRVVRRDPVFEVRDAG